MHEINTSPAAQEDLTIIIAGAAGKGKTALTLLLYRLLGPYAASITVGDADWPISRNHHLFERGQQGLLELFAGRSLHIGTRQLNRDSQARFASIANILGGLDNSEFEEERRTSGDGDVSIRIWPFSKMQHPITVEKTLRIDSGRGLVWEKARINHSSRATDAAETARFAQALLRATELAALLDDEYPANTVHTAWAGEE